MVRVAKFTARPLVVSAHVVIFAIACLFCLSAHARVDTLRPVSVDNHQLPPLEQADIMQSSLRLYPGSPRMAQQFEHGGIDRGLWPSSISRGIRALEAEQAGISLSGGLSASMTLPGTPPDDALRLPEPDASGADDIQLIDHGWLAGRMRVQRLAIGDRIFHILLTSPRHVDEWRGATPSQPAQSGRLAPPIRIDEEREEEHQPFVFTVVEEDADTPPARFRTWGEPPIVSESVNPPVVTPFSGPGEFSAVPWEDGIAIIYRDRGGIFARRLDVHGNAPTFEGEPWRVAAAPETIHRYQLLARADTAGVVHLLWAVMAESERSTLHYCRLVPGSDCHPLELSHSVAVSERLRPINLMLQGDNIYVSWTDTRYTSGVWTKRNRHKLLVAASQDGGRSFARPVSLNAPRDDADQANYAVTLPAPGGGVLVFWVVERMPLVGMWQRHRLHTGWLDAELNRFQVGTTTVSGEDIHDVIERGVLKYHENLGH